jgi:hypothetical protein
MWEALVVVLACWLEDELFVTSGCREKVTFVYLHIDAFRYSMMCLLHGREKFVIMAPSDSILYAA